MTLYTEYQFYLFYHRAREKAKKAFSLANEKATIFA